MNWKNVLYLLRVERKSGRLIRGVKTTRYHENRFLAYWPYWVSAIIGILGALIANLIVSAVYSTGAEGLPPIREAALTFYVALPVLILVASVVLTMLQQIQLSGVKATTQVMYWLPITWQEQTLASVLSNLLGLPFAMVAAFASGAILFAVFNGLILEALLTTLALFAAAFMGSALTEVLRVLQTRFVGAVYKSSGRAAVWVRFIGSLLFFLIFYIFYFSITNGFTVFIQGLTQIQNTFWFIPFLWLDLMVYYFVNGVILTGVLFIVSSVLFIGGLFYLAILLNKRFGLYEPPAISVQKSGAVYMPKTGLLGKIGFSSVEAAIIRKDMRAFTRRRELIGLFIVPIIFIIIPIMQSIGITNSSSTTPSELSLIFSAMTFLLPVGVMAMSIGSVLIGEEGQSVWRIYASPIAPKNLVRSKLFFVILLSLLVLTVTGAVGIIFYHPSVEFIITGYLEGFFLALALGSISLCIGFRGADFSVTRRPRMIRQGWSLIDFVVCTIAGVAILAPLAPYVISMIAGSSFTLIPLTPLNLALSMIVSAIIATIITVVFYRVNIGSARELIRKAEV